MTCEPTHCRRPLAFVAGATGYTGQAVVAELRREGVQTVAHVRPDSTRLEHWRAHFGEQLAAIDSTPWQASAMAETITRLEPTAIYALLGTTRARSRDDGMDYEAVDYAMTAMLLAAARAQTRVRPRFIYLSAMGAGGRTGGNAYLKVRSRIEAELQASDLGFVIARPAFISGPDRGERRPLERWAARSSDGLLAGLAKLGYPGPARKYAALDAATLGRALARVCYDERHLGSVLEAEQLRELGTGPASIQDRSN